MRVNWENREDWEKLINSFHYLCLILILIFIPIHPSPRPPTSPRWWRGWGGSPRRSRSWCVAVARKREWICERMSVYNQNSFKTKNVFIVISICITTMLLLYYYRQSVCMSLYLVRLKFSIFKKFINYDTLSCALSFRHTRCSARCSRPSPPAASGGWWRTCARTSAWDSPRGAVTRDAVSVDGANAGVKRCPYLSLFYIWLIYCLGGL